MNSAWSESIESLAKAATMIVFLLLCFAYCARQEIKEILVQSQLTQDSEHE